MRVILSYINLSNNNTTDNSNNNTTNNISIPASVRLLVVVSLCMYNT